jgi:TonB-dependent SusC/RagA subfamily outer membrane receptor
MRKKCLLTNRLANQHFIFLFLALLFTSFSYGQTITGTVTDDNGKRLPSVTVSVKGSQIATASDSTGRFSITASSNSTLVFTSIGFTEQEVSLNGRTSLTVVLISTDKNLSEVIVTTLGVKKESRKLGYSVTSLNTDELVKQRTLNLGESLEGKVAGLNITPPAAGAGSSNQIRLRGQVGFAGATNSPLIVINGLPMDQGTRNAEGNGQQRDRGDNLNNINPDDIESMVVLKGSTAAALYGSRAAAGAIIITTKSGQKNQGIGVDFTSSYTTMDALNFMDEITQTEYGQGQNGVKFTTAGLFRVVASLVGELN